MQENQLLRVVWAIAFILSSMQTLSYAEESPQPVLKKGTTTGESNAVDTREGSPTGEFFSGVDRRANVIRAEIISVDEKNQEAHIRDVATDNQLKVKVSDVSTLGSFVPGDIVRVTFSPADPATAISIVAEKDWKE